MYVLEYKELYIVKTEQAKNRTCQTYRWKQYAICKDSEPLEQIKNDQKRPEDWRIIKLAYK